MSRRTFIILLVILAALSNAARYVYRERVPAGRFSAESASHFRYTRMVAGGEPIPSPDIKAQYPEGLDVAGETSIAMEYLYGLAHRAMPGGGPPLDGFVRWFSVLVFTLALFPLASISARLWGDRRAGVITAAVFTVALPLVGRSSGFELIRENLALPLIVFHLFAMLLAMEKPSAARAAVSAILLAAALASWQGTQFYLVFLLGLLVVRAALRPGDRGEALAGWAAVAAAALAGLAVPFLREGRFYASAAAALCIAWAASRAARSKGPQARLAAAAAAAAAFVAVSFAVSGHLETYSHFFRLAAYKLRYIGKPSDPALLPFDVRAFWSGPFHSPDVRHLFVFAVPVVLLLPGPLPRLLSRAREGERLPVVVSYFLVLFFALFLLMQRLLPFFGVFAAVTAGGIAALPRAGRGPVAARLVAAGALVVMTLQILFWAGPADIWRRAAEALRLPRRQRFVQYPFEPDPEGRMLAWIERSTAEDDVILASHYHSPQILTYTGRPTNLNDFFEAPRLRRKARRFLSALYSGEGTLLELCRELSSDHVVLSAAVGCDPTLDSPLYQAGLDAVPAGSAAYGMMFDPASLDSFDLVYENEVFRVYEAGAPPVERRRPRSPLFYESELLWRAGGDIGEFYDTVMHIYALTARGAALRSGGDLRGAEDALSRALEVFYFYPAWRLLDSIYAEWRAGGPRLALARFAFDRDPWRLEVRLSLAEAMLARGETEGLAELLEETRALASGRPGRARLERLERLLDKDTGE